MKLRIMLLVGALAASVFPYTSLHAMNYEEERVIKIAKLAPIFTGAWQVTLPNNQAMELVMWQVDPDDFYQQYNGSEKFKGYLKQTITKTKKNHQALYAGYVQIEGQPCKKYIKGVVSLHSFNTQDNPKLGLGLTLIPMRDASIPSRESYKKCDALIPRLVFLAKPPYTVKITSSASDKLIPLNRVSATGGLLAKAKNGRPYIGSNANNDNHNSYYFYMSRSVPTTSELEVIADNTKTLPEVTIALADYHKHLKQIAKPSVPTNTDTTTSVKKAKNKNCKTCLTVDNLQVIDSHSRKKIHGFKLSNTKLSPKQKVELLWRTDVILYEDKYVIAKAAPRHNVMNHRNASFLSFCGSGGSDVDIFYVGNNIDHKKLLGGDYKNFIVNKLTPAIIRTCNAALDTKKYRNRMLSGKRITLMYMRMYKISSPEKERGLYFYRSAIDNMPDKIEHYKDTADMKKSYREKMQAYKMRHHNTWGGACDGKLCGLQGGRYLNAIYENDYRTVYSLDYDLLPQIALRYMFEYQNGIGFGERLRADKCLKKGYVAKTFRYKEGKTNWTTSSGIDLGTTGGSVHTTTYAVNREFEPLLNKLGNSRGRGNASSSRGGWTLDGVERLQEVFDCDSKVIKQFERNLINLTNEYIAKKRR